MQDNIINENSIEYVLGEILCNNKLTISTAESCTGGMVAAKLISYPGISASFLEGAITYSNEAKMKRLGVRKETLDAYGAVSEETAKEMAEGIAKESCSNASIATTGIAGPGGGTNEKPVGLVYIAVHVNKNTTIEKCNFSGNREEVRVSATNHALKMLKVELENQGYK
ncbi:MULTISPECIES: nicotinamide-nucleotide amidohydrolase family protein [unclassified Clostridium]|uniref:CinA family protein n=1 Tax=unclassified Clostridium TaxID=2614128 RepID=UPI00189717F2|nr:MULTISPECIES: nicotinamide-nucleotide amidohydrolase family protein [unclassified Clostridium]MBP3914571.1 nicotinamide-nucleotide amidohydrolase family protein [Clostridium sp.]MEE0932630.1 nicotinamide-nucleotide amidohydrolase family protein [Clostridium sp.]